MKAKIISLALLFVSSVCLCSTRLKDIVTVEGIRENFLVGQGLVVGLNGTGDNLQNSVFTQKELIELLERLRVNVQGSGQLRTRNVAAVTITAKLPPFARQGSRIDVKVNAFGDARSIKGGTLLPTLLLGPDGNTYAVAQGLVVIPEFNPASDEVRTKNKGIETSGFIQNGAIVEEEIAFNFSSLDTVRLALYTPDFTTASSIAEVINAYAKDNIALAQDPGTIKLRIPPHRKKDMVEFISELEQLTITPDCKAKIIIDEATGTIVIGSDIRVRPVAIAQGNLIINIGQRNMSDRLHLVPEVLQGNITRGIDRARGSGVHELSNTTTLSQIVEGLNKLGVWPRDIINVLYSMRAVGALDATIEVR